MFKYIVRSDSYNMNFSVHVYFYTRLLITRNRNEEPGHRGLYNVLGHKHLIHELDTVGTVYHLVTYIVGSKSFRPDIQKPRQMENAVRDI